MDGIGLEDFYFFGWVGRGGWLVLWHDWRKRPGAGKLFFYLCGGEVVVSDQEVYQGGPLLGAEVPPTV